MIVNRSASSRELLLVSSIAATGALVALWITKSWRRRAQQQQLDDMYEEQVELLDIEKTLYTSDEAATSTITWFRGNYKAAAEILKARLAPILEANPWLTGRVVQRNGKLLLMYSKSNNIMIEEYIHILSPEDSPLSRDTPLDKLGAASSKLLVTNGPTQSLLQVTVVPSHNDPSTYFGVVVSMSHIVADGYTFYAIHNMLCSGDKVQSLIVERISDTHETQVAAMGKDEYAYLKSAGYILNMVGGLVWSKFLPAYRVQTKYVRVDRAVMSKIKKLLASLDKNVPYISTNDVLTSWFLRKSGCRHGLLVVNWRDKLAGHTPNHAGNYENVLYYGRDDSTTPTLIRQSLNKLKRTKSECMPSFWERVSGSNATVTNWASFAKPNVIEGCKEELHVPLYDLASILPCTMAVLCIFRAGPQGLALLLAGTEDVLAGLEDAPFLSDKEVL